MPDCPSHEHQRAGHHANGRCGGCRDGAAVLATLALFALLALLLVARPAGAQATDDLSEDAVAALRRSLDAVGGAEALAGARDVEIRGRLETVGFDAAHRTLVRREPFAVREEYRDERGHLVQAHVTDLRHAWRLHDPSADEPGSGRAHGHALDFDEAVPLMLRAWGWRVLLDPLAATSSGRLAPPFVMPDAPFFGEDMGAGRHALTVALGGPLHLSPNLWFDAEDGRWFGWQWGPIASGGMQRLRAGRWRRHGELTLPGLLLDFDERSLTVVRTVEEVVTGLVHDPALFEGDPAPAPAADVELPLEISPGNLPESAHLLIGGVRIDGQGPWWATFDTGSERLVVHPELGDRLDLPVLAPSLVQVLAGQAAGNTRWMDEISLGGARWLQRVAIGIAPMRHLGLVARHQPALIVGTDLLGDVAPVVDLERGRMLFRGRTPTTLAELAAIEARGTGAPAPVGAPLVVEAELHPIDATSTSRAVELFVGDASVRALLDTGASAALRLSPAGLRALGLPLGREAWLARGGLPYSTVGLNGVSLPDLVVRLDELVLPAVDARDGSPLDVVWSRPLVIVSTADDEADEASTFPAILGTGALLSFARVGVDFGRDRIELQPGVRLVHKASDAGARLVVPPPGDYLGFLLRPSGEDAPLPRLADVVPGLPADRAGLVAGDAVERVDGVDCTGMPLAELWPRLWLRDRGSVRLHVLRDGETFEVELP